MASAVYLTVWDIHNPHSPIYLIQSTYRDHCAETGGHGTMVITVQYELDVVKLSVRRPACVLLELA